LELWVSDGTSDGTHLVKDIAPGSASPYALLPFFLGDTLVFSASDGTGSKLWKTDGTDAGTEVMTDLPPLFPSGSFVMRDLMFFSAFDEVTGYELWRTDGTPTGTVRVADIVPGERSSSPSLFGAVGSVLLFGAKDDFSGRELWALDLDSPPIARAGADETTEVGIDVVLDGSASSDPDGDPLAYEWRGASGQVLGTASTLTVGGMAPGSYDYTLTVSDGHLTSSDVVRVTVLEPPSIAIGNATAREGWREPSLAVFEVRLSRASGRAVSVHYVTVNGTAIEPRDYIATSGTLQFAPGDTSMTVAVTVNGDRRCEKNETLLVVLDSAVNGTLGSAPGVGTILNDDCGPPVR
jgi:ELWxxDGT repeat protein